MATITFENGTKVNFDGTPSPADVDEVAQKLGISKPSVDMSLPTPNITSAPRESSAPFPSSPQDGPLAAGLKAVGNTPSSAFNLGKSLVDAVTHPVETVKNLASTAVGAASAGERALLNKTPLGKTLPAPAAPEQQFQQFAQAMIQRYGSLENAKKTATEDPFAVGADIVGLLSGGATLAGKAGLATKAIDATAGLAEGAARPVTAAATKVGDLGKSATRFSISQAMGISQDTISQIFTNPRNFTKEAQASVSRRGIAEEVQAALEGRQNDLSATGKHYGPVRDSGHVVNVDPTFLQDQLLAHAKLTVDGEGKVLAETTSKLRAPSDVRAVQQLYNFWKPAFDKGQLSAEEYLNFRKDLDELANFDRQIGKSTPLESFGSMVRHDLNTKYRNQVPSLEDLDAEFAAQTTDFKRLGKGLIDREGNLTDTAINRIANATGKGKDLLVDRLEEIVPGISQRIKTLKAVEDIENLKGQIPGKYGRAGLFLGAAYTINPYLIVGTLMALPEIGVPVLRGLGMSAAKVRDTLRLLGAPVKALNELPSAGVGPINQIMKDNNIQPGLSLKASYSNEALQSLKERLVVELERTHDAPKSGKNKIDLEMDAEKEALIGELRDAKTLTDDQLGQAMELLRLHGNHDAIDRVLNYLQGTKEADKAFKKKPVPVRTPDNRRFNGSQSAQ